MQHHAQQNVKDNSTLLLNAKPVIGKRNLLLEKGLGQTATYNSRHIFVSYLGTLTLTVYGSLCKAQMQTIAGNNRQSNVMQYKP